MTAHSLLPVRRSSPASGTAAGGVVRPMSGLRATVIALAAIAFISLVGIAHLAQRGRVTSDQRGIIVVDGGGPIAYGKDPVTKRPNPDPALEQDIRHDLPASISAGTDMVDVRLVDSERRIACGAWASAVGVKRRFVWISSLDLVVSDDGGRDFANLVTVCEGPWPR